jgi:hypothetical protein
MTPRQFRRSVDGWNWREERAWERTAALGSWMLSGLVSPAPSAAKLLGREKETVYETLEQAREAGEDIPG